jgi:hypothetical protein
MNRYLTSALLFAAATLACGGEKTAPPTPAGGSTATAAAPAAPATATAGIPPATGTVTSAGGDVGVPECDDFLRKYEACVSQHVPAASKAQFEQGMTQWRAAWKSMAAQPSAKPSLVTACQQALASTKMATTTYGCTW